MASSSAHLPFPPPPRRTVVTTPPNFNTSPPRPTLAERALCATKATWDMAYRLSDRIGAWSNEKAAKLGVEAVYPTSLEVECAKAARILRTFCADEVDMSQEAVTDLEKTQKVLNKIPTSAIEGAHGLAIFTVVRTGFLISGAGGSGIVVAKRDDGSWSAPSGILLHTIGGGLLAGLDVYDVVLILRTPAAVASFTHPRFSLGGDINVAAGPVGAGGLVEASIDSKPSPVWSYIKSKGAYAGVALEGTVIIERNDENERSYGHAVKASDVLSGAGVPRPPHWVDSLHRTIEASAGRNSWPPAPATSSPASPATSPASTSTSPARRLPPTEPDAEDLEALSEMRAALVSFGIEDPDVNAQARHRDPALLRGEELQAHLERSAAKGKMREMEPGSAGHSRQSSGAAFTTSGLLSDVVEAPPSVDTPVEDAKNDPQEKQQQSVNGTAETDKVVRRPSAGGTPRMPPRRKKVPSLDMSAEGAAENSV